MSEKKLPSHIAFIMDGNGRWAKQRGLARTAGHRAGIKRTKEIVNAAAKLGIKVVTFFAFSTENWSRPKREIATLMRYLNNFLEKEIRELEKDNMRFVVIGSDDPLPRYLIEKIRQSEQRTRNNTGMVVVLALNYGARQEIVDAAKRFARAVAQGKERPEDLNTERFSDYLYTAGLPDPDLLIRTSGEMRMSNFLLWQISYAEIYFSRAFWPDFTKEELEEAIRVYQKRERRFGNIHAEEEDN